MASVSPAKAIVDTCNDEGETLYSLTVLLNEIKIKTTNKSKQLPQPECAILAPQSDEIIRRLMRLIVYIFNKNGIPKSCTIFLYGPPSVYLSISNLYFTHNGTSLCIARPQQKITKESDEWSEIKDLMTTYPSELYEYFVNLIEQE